MIAPLRGKIGKGLQSEPFLSRVEPVARRLREDGRYGAVSRGDVCRLLAEMAEFMEDAVGENGTDKAVPAIPAKLFLDYAPNGALFVMAAKCLEERRARNLSASHFNHGAEKKQNLEILMAVRRELEKTGLLKHPKVHVHHSCGAQIQRLRGIVKQLGGSLAGSADAPSVTHVVYPFGASGDPDDGQQYLRALERCNETTYVHWWYLPDSRDQFIAAENAPEDLEPDRIPIGPWKVYLRWLLDSEMYNEWMNPIDYETEEFQDEQDRLNLQKETASTTPMEGMEIDVAAAEAGRIAEEDKEAPAVSVEQAKRKRDESENEEGEIRMQGVTLPPSGDDREPKRVRMEAPEERPEIDATSSKQIAQNVSKHKVLEPHKPAVDGSASVEDVSQGQQILPPPGVPVAKAEPALDVMPPDVEPPAPPIVRKELYRVPAHASWFNWTKIHDLERQGVPDFFNGRSVSKTPKVYKEYRDFVINKYRENPDRRLTFTEVRKFLAGDVNGIMRVFSFLEHWGLINFMAKDGPKEKSQVDLGLASSGPPPSMKITGQNSAPSSMGIFKFPQPSCTEAANAATRGGQLNLATRKTGFGRLVQYTCNAMPWVDCTTLRYHCTALPNVDLCPQAYAEGRFPPGTSAKDFVRIEQDNEEVDAAGWTQQETLLLLEGIELYGDNWSEVAEHIGSKSQLQCIMHFLQLPIEDEYLDDMGDASGTTLATANGEADHADAASLEGEEEPIPFADAKNPVLAQVAFLASMVGPKVAAAAAQRALEVLSEEDPAVIKELEASVDKGRNGASHHGGGAGPGEDTQSTSKEKTNGSAVSMARMRIAAAAAMSAATVRAKLLADQEEREIQRLVVAAIESQIRKLEMKAKYFEELDKALESEISRFKSARMQMEAERTRYLELAKKASHQLAAARNAATLPMASRQTPISSPTGTSKAPSPNPVPSVPPASSPAFHPHGSLQGGLVASVLPSSAPSPGPLVHLEPQGPLPKSIDEGPAAPQALPVVAQSQPQFPSGGAQVPPAMGNL
eukprot:evm.model.scf_1407.2 EVM.evm.TU.scf_1407.2   scf_1407:7799-21268(+)